ncbi:hypothetical protein [Mycolicibacterium phocaicum]|uniref:hypothetical protein n=1 Tax=Mycolicibacterium phocaicum TaxID=319706 RepID=UPI001CFA63A1|nr:hypothetical protein [Mycolicibacterium phocaicum]UCZ58697.1 hypothetical protein LHJ73_18145 [Mycolicibacterium phocaicum]
MNSSVLPWIKKTVFAHTESDQCVADRERLEHELAVKDEEIAELKRRVEELEASVEFHSEQRLQAIARAGIERVRS